MTSSAVVQRFFEQYERSRNTFDPGLLDAQYPDAFMFAGPAGVRVAEKSAVLAGLSKGSEFLKRLGHTTTTLASLGETTMDEHYTIVRARFVWRFERESAQTVDVDVESTFVLHLKDGEAKIVFQHEHEDFQQALRARGVVPPLT